MQFRISGISVGLSCHSPLGRSTDDAVYVWLVVWLGCRSLAGDFS